MKPYITLKFGGSSVSTFKNWENIMRRIDELKNTNKILIVISALYGVTNMLTTIINPSTTKSQRYNLISQILKLHTDLATEAGIPVPEMVIQYYGDLRLIVRHMCFDSELLPETQAEILSFGELLATSIGIDILKQKFCNVVLIDSRNIIKTKYDSSRTSNENYLDTIIIPNKILYVVNIYETKDIILTQGFIGSVQLPSGKYKTCLLGRGGGDTSGSLYSYITNSVKYEIYTDVNGVYDSDPRVNSNAKILLHLTYDEAELMAKNGAKVIHDRCIVPLRLKNIPCSIQNTNLNKEYTLISH